MERVALLLHELVDQSGLSGLFGLLLQRASVDLGLSTGKASLLSRGAKTGQLRATGGAGFDLAQPSQDRITGPQQEFKIYKPMDMSKIKADLFIPSMLAATKKRCAVKMGNRGSSCAG